ncbi:hypothetical protein EG68_01928 [Paragonimus skrjabini miyazakii]|uniref:Uncharacterized protein n=1 Tax=Paragonimus skrjabini miyazakii TaxID=59628 RepID=A0A8S9Z115_9TREM|nr:hypothetical protein EG68_01928 [Paragonimus skrjabini miyazakii]
MSQYTEQDIVKTKPELFYVKHLNETDSTFLLDSEDERITERSSLINSLLDAKSKVLTHNSLMEQQSVEEALHFDGSHIPPLDLCSRDSSVTDSNDALKGTLDIDFRDGNEHENYLTEANKDGLITNQSISDRWNQYSNELHKKQTEQKLARSVSLIKSTPNVVTTVKKQYSNQKRKLGEAILVGNKLIAHNLTAGENHDRHKTDFVEANKNLRNLSAPKYSGSYGLLHKTKTNFGMKDPSSLEYSDSGHSRLFPSRSRYLSYSMPRLYVQSGHERLMDFDHHQPSSSPELCSTHPNVLRHISKHKTKDSAWFQPPACSWFTSPSNIPVYTGLINPQRRRYASAERLGQTVQKFPQPVSASGVFRMGLQQQVNLIQAHQEFLRNRVSPAKQQTQEQLIQPSWFCSNENLFYKPSSSRTEPYISNINHQMHPLSNSLSRNQQPLRPDDNLHAPKIRYTLKDYALLPRIQTQSRSLGPDLESEDYKIKLAKYQRQQGYAELLRKQAIKRQRNLSRKLLLPRAQSNLSDTIMTCSATNTGYDDNESVLISDRSIAVTDSSRTLTNREMQQEVYSNLTSKTTSQSNSLKGQTKLTKPTFTTSCLSLNEKDITQKELQRQEANKKREAMLCYAKQIRVNFVKQRKQTSCSVVNQMLSSNHGEMEAAKCAPGRSSKEQTHPHLSELLRRHEDDRKQAEAIRKSLKVFS